MTEENEILDTPETGGTEVPNEPKEPTSEKTEVAAPVRPEAKGSDRSRGGRSNRDNPNDPRGKKGGGGRNRRGRGEREEKEFQEEVLDIARVTRVVKGGRRMRFRATVIIGDRKGRVGLGTGKSVEVSVAVQKAVAMAKKQLIMVPIENSTIPHEVTWKHKSSRILLMPAKVGTGIIAGGAVRKIAELAGIENIRGKTHGTNNPLVNAQSMIEALQSFRKARKGKEEPESREERKPEPVAAE